MSGFIIALCIVQGIGEFLPISSSTHLYLLSVVFKQPPTSLEWEVALHLGTLIAVVAYFWKDLIAMTMACFRAVIYPCHALKDSSFLKAFYIVMATVPAMAVGYGIKKSGIHFESVKLMGAFSILFGILLYCADKYGKVIPGTITGTQAIGIGLAQVLAFLPAVSRSGICVTAGRLLGSGRVEAMRFAFLLSIPTVLGAVVLTGYDALQQNIAVDFTILVQAITLTSLFGLVSIRTVLWYLGRHGFSVFAVYRIILGVILFFV
ncbi:MAG: undecaprenyl-diphosphate phosphatase [Alphaproteobacteria bacterium]|nr:undecaprenyl-diphosphate phosphatase [Alphaproteobacteria bacterium]